MNTKKYPNTIHKLLTNFANETINLNTKYVEKYTSTEYDECDECEGSGGDDENKFINEVTDVINEMNTKYSTISTNKNTIDNFNKMFESL